MDDSFVASAPASFEKAHRMLRKLLNGPSIGFLLRQSLMVVTWGDPFGAWPAIGGQKARGDVVSMEFPAGVVTDRLQSDVDEIAAHNFHKRGCQRFDVLQKGITHLDRRRARRVENGCERGDEIVFFYEQPGIRKFMDRQRIDPMPEFCR